MANLQKIYIQLTLNLHKNHNELVISILIIKKALIQ